jgi:hypothetical protein
LGVALSDVFGTSSKTAEFAPLAAGFVRVALDHYAQEYVVVIDANVDQASLQRRLEKVALANAASGTRPFKVRVISSCLATDDLLQARQIIEARSRHPRADEATFTSEINPYTSQVDVSFDPAFKDVGAALKERLGDKVSVS